MAFPKLKGIIQAYVKGLWKTILADRNVLTSKARQEKGVVKKFGVWAIF